MIKGIKKGGYSSMHKIQLSSSGKLDPNPGHRRCSVIHTLLANQKSIKERGRNRTDIRVLKGAPKTPGEGGSGDSH